MTNSEFQKKIDLLENRVKKLEEAQEQNNKFKVGDQVQFVKDKKRTGIINEIKDGFALVKEGDAVWMLALAELEPYAAPKFKVGDKVKEKETGLIGFVTSFYINNDIPTYEIKVDDYAGVWIWKESTLEPYVEPQWAFTDDEKVILRYLPEEYKWIARDENGNLYIYQDRPDKGGECWHSNEVIDLLTCFCHLFQSIKWTDEEACEFRKFI